MMGSAPKYNVAVTYYYRDGEHNVVERFENASLIESAGDFLTLLTAEGVYVFLNREDVRRIEATPVSDAE